MVYSSIVINTNIFPNKLLQSFSIAEKLRPSSEPELVHRWMPYIWVYYHNYYGNPRRYNFLAAGHGWGKAMFPEPFIIQAFRKSIFINHIFHQVGTTSKRTSNHYFVWVELTHNRPWFYSYINTSDICNSNSAFELASPFPKENQ